MKSTVKTTAVFLRPFELASFNEVLPAGEYRIETELPGSLDCIEPGDWMSSVLVHLHPRASHPGLSRTLTVPLAELAQAAAKDKLTGKGLADYVLEELLADPMTCLVMQADGVSEGEVRGLYSAPAVKQRKGKRLPRAGKKFQGHKGMTPHPGSPRPGIGE